MKNIAGLDIGASSAVCCVLSEFPNPPRRVFSKMRRDIVKVKPDSAGFEYLESLALDAIVLEPTGGHYSRIWWLWAKSKGIEVCWVGHSDLAGQRRALGFSNKRDDEDAFVLAATYWDDRFVDDHGRRRWLYWRPDIIDSINQRFLECEQLDKSRTAGVNQLRQRLQHEFPEIAKTEFKPQGKNVTTPAFRWLTGQHTYKWIEKKYAASVVHQLDIEISAYTRQLAARLVDLENQLYDSETALSELLADPELEQYMKVFKRFGFGLRNQALLITALYPFDKFLVDGRPFIEWEEVAEQRGRARLHQQRRNKRQKRDRSRRAFQAFLGLSYSMRQSGDSFSKQFHGSTQIRSHLYMWCVGKLRAGDPWFTVETEVGKQLAAKAADLTAGGVVGGDKITRLLFKASALLYRELKAEFVTEARPTGEASIGDK